MDTMKVYIAHASVFDFARELYEPIKQSALWTQHEIFLPHDQGRNLKTRTSIEQSGLLIAEISYPATGEGIELGWADAAGVKIAAVYRRGSQYSSSVSYLTDKILEYNDAGSLIMALITLIEQSSQL